jgi:hypothetical protein
MIRLDLARATRVCYGAGRGTLESSSAAPHNVTGCRRDRATTIPVFVLPGKRDKVKVTEGELRGEVKGSGVFTLTEPLEGSTMVVPPDVAKPTAIKTPDPLSHRAELWRRILSKGR